MQEPEPTPTPTPEQEPEDPAAPEQDPGILPPQGNDQMQSIQDAIEQVRQGFSDLDKSLLATRDLVEERSLDTEDTDGNQKSVGEFFKSNLEDAEQLLSDMENLLALLPTSEQEQSSSSSSGSGEHSPGQQDQKNEPQQQKDSNNRDQGKNLGDKESNQQQSDQLPPFPVQPIFMTPGQGGGAWGHLPPRLQQTLQNAQAEDLPLRYRGLLEEFHKKNLDQR